MGNRGAYFHLHIVISQNADRLFNNACPVHLMACLFSFLILLWFYQIRDDARFLFYLKNVRELETRKKQPEIINQWSQNRHSKVSACIRLIGD